MRWRHDEGLRVRPRRQPGHRRRRGVGRPGGPAGRRHRAAELVPPGHRRARTGSSTSAAWTSCAASSSRRRAAHRRARHAERDRRAPAGRRRTRARWPRRACRRRRRRCATGPPSAATCCSAPAARTSAPRNRCRGRATSARRAAGAPRSPGGTSGTRSSAGPRSASRCSRPIRRSRWRRWTPRSTSSDRPARAAIPMREFHLTPHEAGDPTTETRLAPDELIVGYRIPTEVRDGQAYVKIRERASYEYAIVSAAATVVVAGGEIVTARVALGSVAQRPWRLTAAETELSGAPLTREALQPDHRARDVGRRSAAAQRVQGGHGPQRRGPRRSSPRVVRGDRDGPGRPRPAPVEGALKLTGAARYAADHRPPGRAARGARRRAGRGGHAARGRRRRGPRAARGHRRAHRGGPAGVPRAVAALGGAVHALHRRTDPVRGPAGGDRARRVDRGRGGRAGRRARRLRAGPAGPARVGAARARDGRGPDRVRQGRRRRGPGAGGRAGRTDLRAGGAAPPHDGDLGDDGAVGIRSGDRRPPHAVGLRAGELDRHPGREHGARRRRRRTCA